MSIQIPVIEVRAGLNKTNSQDLFRSSQTTLQCDALACSRPSTRVVWCSPRCNTDNMYRTRKLGRTDTEQEDRNTATTPRLQTTPKTWTPPCVHGPHALRLHDCRCVARPPAVLGGTEVGSGRHAGGRGGVWGWVGGCGCVRIRGGGGGGGGVALPSCI